MMRQLGDLRDLGWAVVRIFLGVAVLIAAFFALDLIVYISSVGSTFSDKVIAAGERGYEEGHTQAYRVAYRKAHAAAYDEGYDKGYEIGVGSSGSGEVVATLVELRNPTYREMLDFLGGDETDSNPFIKGEYVCFEFAADVNNNAEANGIRAAYVRIRFEEWGHAVVAFETVDRGLIFIEPQTDKQVTLVIGEPYPWQATGANRSSNYDDVIVEIQIIW